LIVGIEHIFYIKDASFDFLVEPFSYDRLTIIANSESLPPRVEEEKRLENLNLRTKTIFSYLLN